VSREIKRNIKISNARANDCLHKPNCKLTRVCGKNYCAKVCSRTCPLDCIKYCSKYESAKCDKLLEPPYVCNGCGGISSCTLEKHLYRAKYAEECYRSTLTESRSGFDLTDEELVELNALVSPLLEKGQSPYHILTSHKDEIKVSQMTLYKLIDSGLLDANNATLKQKVKRKPRKNTRRGKLHNEVQGVSVAKVGRLWSDFNDYIEENDTFYVQMDCVEGKAAESPALLTLHYPDYQMQLAIYLNRQNAEHVVGAFDYLETTLGTELFMETFPIILTDNGIEFTDIAGMETSCINPSVRRTKVFFCEPNRSDEKGACENNHKLIRDVIPKGTSLLPFDQSDITLMMNHINSYRRKRAFGKSAYDKAMADFPKDFFEKLNLTRIPDDEVTLHPTLLRKRINARKKGRDYRLEDKKRIL